MRKIALLGVVIFIAGLGQTAVAAASQKPSSELGRFYQNYYPSVRTMSGFAQCLVGRDIERVKASLRETYSSNEQHEKLSAFIDRNANCMDRMDHMAAENIYFLGALAEQVMKREGRAVPSSFDTPRLPAGGSGSFVWTDKRLRNAQDLADLSLITGCFMNNDSADVAKLLLTKGATEDERRQLNAMVPQLTQCVPSGKTMSFEPITLRAGLAYAQFLATDRQKVLSIAWLGGEK